MIEVEWEDKLARDWPNLSLGLVVIKGVNVRRSDDKIIKLIKECEEEVRNNFKLETLKDIPEIRAYRNFFWRINVDPTKKRPSVEALIRRILRGKGIPLIFNVVDICNIISIRNLITISAFDLEAITPPLKVRYSRSGERVELIGGRIKTLTGREIVLEDGKHNILSVYAYSDAEISKVKENTKNILAVAYGVPRIRIERIKKCISDIAEHVSKLCGGRVELVKVVCVS